MKFTTAITLLLFTASTMAAEQSVRGAAVVAIDTNYVDASFWTWMYNALKCPPGPLGKHCHSGSSGGSGGGSSSSGSSGSSGGSGGDDGIEYPCTGTSNDGGGCGDDDASGAVQYPVGTSNDSGSSVTPSNGSGGVFSSMVGSNDGSQSAVVAMVGVALVAVAVVAAVILRKKRAGASAVGTDKKTALIDVEMSPTGEPKEGLVSSRLKSFNEFMRSRAADPVEQGFEAGADDSRESSKIDFIECKN